MATITELYTRRGLELKPKGGGGERGPEFCGPCPECGGEDRFLVWPEQNGGAGSYACRRCGKAGDVIQFLMDFDGLPFREARTAAGFEGDGSYRPSACPSPPKQRAVPRIAPADVSTPEETWRTKATNFARACHEILLQRPDTLSWLARRGLPEDAVRAFGLGWNAGDGKHPYLMRPRKVWGLPDVPPEKEGGKSKKNIWLPRGLVIPLFERDGTVLRLRIRRPEADRKNTGITLPYYVVPGSGMAPLWIAQRHGTLPPSSVCMAVESELDAMAVSHAAGDICAVLGMMTARIAHLPPDIMRAVSACARILVATDWGDNMAGASGWEIWRDTFPQARRWVCIHGKDPGEMAQSGQDLRAWVIAGLPDTFLRIVERKRAAPAQPAPDADTESGAAETSPDHPQGHEVPSPSTPVALHPAPAVAADLPYEVFPQAAGSECYPLVVVDSDLRPDTFPPESYGSTPLARLSYTPHGPQDALRILARAGLRLLRWDDNTISIAGADEWGMDERFSAEIWAQRHKDLLLQAAGIVPGARHG
ncbi:MAG: zinc-binding protein [Desulfovibrio sp.]|jgi:hypothetical protein|nr:zinc-binding protein [Desulfovibrio sp.]